MITVKHETNKASPISYPCVGVYKGNLPELNNLTVFFYENGRGFVIEAVKNQYPIGYHAVNWDRNLFDLKDAVISF